MQPQTFCEQMLKHCIINENFVQRSFEFENTKKYDFDIKRNQDSIVRAAFCINAIY